MTFLILVCLVVLVLVGIVSFIQNPSKQVIEKSPYQYLAKKYFLTRAEQACFNALTAAVGNEYYVFAQVHLDSILNEEMRGQNWKGARAHINQKSVDFLLCDKTDISPKLAIELDDKSHERADRKERDSEVERILKEAGIPLLRLQNHGNLDVTELADKVRVLI